MEIGLGYLQVSIKSGQEPNVGRQEPLSAGLAPFECRPLQLTPARALLQKAGGDTAPARDARDASGAAEPEVDAQLVCALSL